MSTGWFEDPANCIKYYRCDSYVADRRTCEMSEWETHHTRLELSVLHILDSWSSVHSMSNCWYLMSIIWDMGLKYTDDPLSIKCKTEGYTHDALCGTEGIFWRFNHQSTQLKKILQCHFSKYFRNSSRASVLHPVFFISNTVEFRLVLYLKVPRFLTSFVTYFVPYFFGKYWIMLGLF